MPRRKFEQKVNRKMNNKKEWAIYPREIGMRQKIYKGKKNHPKTPFLSAEEGVLIAVRVLSGRFAAAHYRWYTPLQLHRCVLLQAVGHTLT